MIICQLFTPQELAALNLLHLNPGEQAFLHSALIQTMRESPEIKNSLIKRAREYGISRQPPKPPGSSYSPGKSRSPEELELLLKKEKQLWEDILGGYATWIADIGLK